MASLALTEDNFKDTIDANDVVMVDFWASWCGPCKQFSPIYEQVSEKYPDVVFGKVNTEEAQQLAGMFQVRSIPTLMIFRQQIIVFSQAGSLPAPALEEVVDKVLKLDMDDVRAEIAKQQKEKA